MRAAIGIAALACVACSHVTTIDTSPSRAKVKVDGVLLGESPVTYEEKTGWKKSYLVECELKDHVIVKKRIEQTEWNVPLTVTALCCSAGLGTPLSGIGALPLAILFFSRQLPDQVVIALEPAPPSPSDAATNGPVAFAY